MGGSGNSSNSNSNSSSSDGDGGLAGHDGRSSVGDSRGSGDAPGGLGGDGRGGFSGGGMSNSGGWGFNGDPNTEHAMSVDRANGGLGPGADNLGAALGNLGNVGRTPGGLFSGGPLNGWSTLGTIAGLAVPGLAPAMGLIGLGNIALGATNSMGLTNTGEISSPRTVAGSLMDKIGGMSSMTASNENTDSPAPAAQDGQQQGTQTADAGTAAPGRSPSGGGYRQNEPVRDPGILAAITGLPASVFTKPASPYALSRNSPELSQGKTLQNIWGALRG